MIEIPTDTTPLLLFGDVRNRLRDIPSDSIDCVVTSPPYWGLRDYGTGSWEGGDESCDHLGPPKNTQAGFNERYTGKPSKKTDKQGALRVPFKDECGKCGAKRVDRQIGMEPTPDAFVETMVDVFQEVRRVLKPTGTVWLNLGDSYASKPVGSFNGGSSILKGRKVTAHQNSGTMDKARGSGLKAKNLIGIPWRVAFALQADGWWLRSDIIWSKPNPMPESVTDRPTRSHEYIFLMTKSSRYFFDADAVKEQSMSGPSDVKKMLESKERIGGKHLATSNPKLKASSATNIGRKRAVGSPTHRNVRSVWMISTQPYHGAHFATFPEAIPERCIKAGCPQEGVVLDPFAGSGTALAVARRLGRRSIGIELNEDEYGPLIRKRTMSDTPDLAKWSSPGQPSDDPIQRPDQER